MRQVLPVQKNGPKTAKSVAGNDELNFGTVKSCTRINLPSVPSRMREEVLCPASVQKAGDPVPEGMPDLLQRDCFIVIVPGFMQKCREHGVLLPAQGCHPACHLQRVGNVRDPAPWPSLSFVQAKR